MIIKLWFYVHLWFGSGSVHIVHRNIRSYTFIPPVVICVMKEAAMEKFHGVDNLVMLNKCVWQK